MVAQPTLNKTAAMSTTITAEMIREAYRVARRVFDGELRPGKGVEALVESSGFNASSARDAVENLGHMLRGRVYKRVNSLAMTEHFLGKILEDYGVAGLRHALAALELHLDYYATVKTGSRQQAERALLAKFSEIAQAQDAGRGADALTPAQRDALAREGRRLDAEGAFDPADDEDARRRVAASIVVRQGQAEFRERLLARYGGRCAVSGCRVAAVLEAAHVTPYLGPRTNHPSNGLLLRADLHTLFDLGLLAIDAASLTVLVAPALDGTEYEAFRGSPLRGPADPSAGPDRATLDLHRQGCGF